MKEKRVIDFTLLSVVVMSFTRQYFQYTINDPENQPVFIINALAPESAEFSFQWFRFP